MKDAESFAKNYKVLETTVEKLRSSNMEDVDNLIKTVEDANQAYRNCKDRLESIKKVLQKD